MKAGVTGHQKLDKPSDWNWVEGELRRVLRQLPPPIIGISSLAVGADQAFARLVLDMGGSLEVIVPFEDYERTFTNQETKREYFRLLALAQHVDTLKHSGTDEEAYLAAGRLLTDRSDLVIAVWNGKPAAGLGGTADIVAYARERGKEIVHLNPDTQTISRVQPK